MNLVIVESPAKAKTIQKFLGNDYKVTSSYGHIRDLKKRDFSIDVNHQYKPIYEIPDDKKELVANLQKEAKKADMVWLASDEDREGEAISWHLYEVLGLEPERTRRIVFHQLFRLDAFSRLPYVLLWSVNARSRTSSRRHPIAYPGRLPPSTRKPSRQSSSMPNCRNVSRPRKKPKHSSKRQRKLPTPSAISSRSPSNDSLLLHLQLPHSNRRLHASFITPSARP